MKIKDTSIGTRLFLGTGIMLLLVLLLAGFAYQQAKLLWENTDNLYNHPLQVSNATQEIQTNIVNIQLLMKDIVLDKKITRNEIHQIESKIDTY